MKASTQMVLALILVALGIVLMIGGVATGKHGATVVGIVVSGVAARSLIVLRDKRGSNEKR